MYGKCVASHQKRTYAAWLLCGCGQVVNEIFHLPLLMDVFSGDLIRFYGVPLPVIQKLVLTDPFVYL